MFFISFKCCTSGATKRCCMNWHGRIFWVKDVKSGCNNTSILWQHHYWVFGMKVLNFITHLMWLFMVIDVKKNKNTNRTKPILWPVLVMKCARNKKKWCLFLLKMYSFNQICSIHFLLFSSLLWFKSPSWWKSSCCWRRRNSNCRRSWKRPERRRRKVEEKCTSCRCAWRTLSHGTSTAASLGNSEGVAFLAAEVHCDV